MKKGIKVYQNTFILFSFLLCNQVLAQSPNYFDNSPSWNETSWLEDDVSGWEDSDNFIQLNGDTIISGLTYNIVASSLGYQEFYRQEGRMIYKNQDGIDTLFISYEHEVGDSIMGCFRLGITPGVIQKIDSILIGTEYRKVFYIDTINTGIEVIEGIAIRNKSNCYGSMFRRVAFTPSGLAYAGPGNAKNYFYTYSLDGEAQLNYDEAYCNDLLSVYQEPVLEAENVYPNPSSGQYHFTVDGMSDVQLFDASGNLVFKTETTDQTINIEHLPNGIYYCQIDTGVKIHFVKLIKL